MGVDYGYGDKKPKPRGKKPGGRIIWEKPRIPKIPKPKPKPNPRPGKNGGVSSTTKDPGFFKPRKPPVKVGPGKAPGKMKPIKRSGRDL